MLIDYNNKELTAEFEYILEQSEGMFSVLNGNTTAFMNNKGEIVTPFIYKKHPCFFNGGLCVAAYKNFNKGFDVINKKGEVLYHSDKYRDVFNAGNGCILAENQDGEYEFKRLL